MKIKRCNQWEELLSLTIDRVVAYDDLQQVEVWLEEGEVVVTFEPSRYSDQSVIGFYKSGALSNGGDSVKMDTLHGKEIVRIVVPYLSTGCHSDAFVLFEFADGDEVVMATQSFTPIRIS